MDDFQTNGTLNLGGALTVTSSALDLMTNMNDLVAGGTITVNGGDLDASASTIDANSHVVITAGTFTAPGSGENFTIAGNFTHSTAGTFIANNGSVVFDGTDQSILGDANTTFNSFTKSVTTAATLTFTTSATQTFTGTLTMTGTMGNVLSIDSDTVGVQAPIGLQMGGIQDLNYLQVRDSDASSGLMLVARNSSEPFGNTTNWDFDGTVITWDGDINSDWNNPSNWDLGVVPTDNDTAVIPSTGTDPVLMSNVNVTATNIGTGVLLQTDGYNFAIAGTLMNDGTLQIDCAETVSIGVMDTDSGVVEYVGDSDGLAETCIIEDYGTTDYFNLVINDGDAINDNFQTNGTLMLSGTLGITSSQLDVSTNMNAVVVSGTLQINGGSLLATSGSLDINSGVVITSGTLTAPSAGQGFTVASDWFVSPTGTFIHSNGKVDFDSLASTTITGNTRFHDFESTEPGKTFYFEDGSNQTVENTMILIGASGNEIVFRSIAGGAFSQTFTTAAPVVVFVNVEDAQALTNDVNCFNCIDNDPGSTLNWNFAVLAITTPVDGRTVDQTPVIIGEAAPGVMVDIKNSAGTVIQTVTATANGLFMFEVSGTLLPVGADTLTPFVGPAFGGPVNINVVVAPTVVQQPIITSPVDNQRIYGAMPFFEGEGLPSDSAYIFAYDLDGNTPVTLMGSGSLGITGTFNVQATTAFQKGVNYVSVVVNGVASDITELLFVDPFGVVFDSISGDPLSNATVTIINNTTGLPAVAGIDIHPTDVNPVITGTNGLYAFLTVSADYHITVERASYDYPSILTVFPNNRTIVQGSKGEVFTVGTAIIEMDHPMDPGSDLLRVEKTVNKDEVLVGEVVTYTVTIENVSDVDAKDILLRDLIPPGFKYLPGKAILDGEPLVDPTGNRPVFFAVGDIDIAQIRTLKYQLVVGSGVTTGEYQNIAYATHASQLVLSNMATESVTVVVDPLFDLGTTIGKVFFDNNENGIQDAPYFSTEEQRMVEEPPVPNVRIVMEDGTVITTDKDGRYHVPALTPGRHIFRLDERTLPDGVYLTTEKAVIVDVTQGLLLKVNFGVKMDDESVTTAESIFFTNKVKVQQDQSKPNAILNVDLFEDGVNVYEDKAASLLEFRIFTNYAAFIDTWMLEVYDKDTNKMFRSFEGDRLNIHDSIIWDGRDVGGKVLSPDRNYEYRLFVEDKDGNFDETIPKSLPVTALTDTQAVAAYQLAQEEKRKDYRNWIVTERAKSNHAVQTILIDGETVSIDRLDAQLQTVRIMKSGKLLTEIPVLNRRTLTAQGLIKGETSAGLDSEAQLDVILPKGSYELVIQEAIGMPVSSGTLGVSEDGTVITSVGDIQSYSKPIQVGEDYLFFVAMGDVKAGYTSVKGNIEPVQQADKYKGGYWSEGKGAYYLQGKVLGKYLITSSFDSDRDRKELFRNLDPDKYYPVYGDESSIDYEATNTQGNLYLLMEWDKSSVIWGNYSVGFNDTEFAKFSRSLYGGKVDYESLATTKYGDARTKAVAFRARAQQKSAHNEFLATGGSLYFLKHKDVIEGSEKVTIQVRDKITGLVISEREMVEGADYELDYDSARMIFWKPIPILVEAYSIISDDLLNGNLVYVAVDYEYDVSEKFDEANVGARFKQAVTDNVLVGGTYVKENLDSSDYQLGGTDVTVKIGEDATIVAEYAQSESEAQPSFVSTDGGLSFTELVTADDASGTAYGIRGDARLFNRLGVSSYYKWIDNDFSTSATTAQQGKALIGFESVYDFSDKTRATFRYDIQELLDDGNLQTQIQVGANKTKTTMFQIVHEARNLKITSEYRRKVIKDQTSEDIIAARVDYQVNEKVSVGVAQQLDVAGDDYKTTVDITAEPTEVITVRMTETWGKDGSATSLGVQAEVNDRLALTGDYSRILDEYGKAKNIGGVGAIATMKMNEKSEVKATFGLSSETGFTRSASVLLGAEQDLVGGTKVGGQVGATDTGSTTATVTLGGTTQLDDDTTLESNITLAEGLQQRSTEFAIGGKRKVDETTEVENRISFAESAAGDQSTAFTFGTKKKLTDTIELLTSRTFGASEGSQSVDSSYSLSKVRDGKTLTGSYTKRYGETDSDVSRSNIFGLTGDITNRWAITGSYERANVANLDGTRTDRDAVSVAVGYVKRDEETGVEQLKSSTKVEVRFDEGTEETRSYLLSNVTEGKVTEELTVFGKAEMSATRNRTNKLTEADYKEFVVGAAYRPIMHDNMNFMARYTYLENQSPDSQEDKDTGIEEQRAQVLALEGVFDITDRWQLSEKFAYRILDEKVTGFNFTKTHTWLMIHRMNYKIDSDWSLGGEFRMLSQREARDSKRGILLEAVRKIGEYAQLGIGYDFTDFDDDLTKLDYTTQGPFIRITGKFYDRTPEEIEREKQRILDEKIARWAVVMVQEELEKDSSPIIDELNEYLALAQMAYDSGDYETAKMIYKDIITASTMMYDEASAYIRTQVGKEQRLKDMNDIADQYMKNGQFDKARKILEKILEEAEKGM